MLNLNTLVEWIDEDSKTPKVERVLRYDSANEIYALIDIFSEKALPVLRSKEEILTGLSNGMLRILETDPFANLVMPENEIPEKHRLIRDAAWNTISFIVEAEGLSPFLEKSRGKLVAEAVVRTGATKKTIYRNLRRFWQSGMTKNANLPAYKNCGTNNKWRKKEDPVCKKLGRPNRLSKIKGGSLGIIITPSIKRKFERGVKKHYERPGKTGLRWAYRRTLNDSFNTGYEIKDGVPVPVLPKSEELPTFDQFYYWYEKEFRFTKRELTARLGKREFEMNHRALLGDATAMAFGPGSLYDIDATIADVYLVSEFIRSRIIGRPVIYFVIDVFSRYIVGIAVTLEGPSWLGAMLALDNVVADKVAFCAEYGITIKPEQWNSQFIGEAIRGDGGEIKGYNIEPLINAFGVRVKNAPPYRGDFKPFVERAFGKANEGFIHFLPGAVIKARERGGKDHRLDAVLTLREFYALLIQYVLNYNSNNYLSHYRRDEFQIADRVELYPQDLWNWGIENRSGHLRVIPRETVRLNLLPRKEVSVTAHGIHFEKEIYYTCDLAREQGWFERARQRKSRKIEVAYDPRDLTNVYLPLKNGREMEVCHLTPAAKVFQLRDWYSAADYFESKLENKLENKTRELQSEAEFHAKQQQIISEASKKTRSAKQENGKQSNKSQTENIRQNRHEEREMERSQKYFDLTGENSKAGQNFRNDVAGVEQDEYVPAASNLSRISEIRKRKMGK